MGGSPEGNPRERFWVPRPRFCEGGSFFFCGLFFLDQRRAYSASIQEELSTVKCKCSIRNQPGSKPKTHPHEPEVGAPNFSNPKAKRLAPVVRSPRGISSRKIQVYRPLAFIQG